MKKPIGFLTVVIVLCSIFSGFALAENQIVDVDLTALSITMRAAEMFNMQMQPENYLGKTVKLQGSYSVTYSESTNTPYHFVLVADAAACCQQGMEFIWNGEHAFPEDYPVINKDIEVLGVFSVYEKAGYLRYYIATENIIVP